MSDRCLHLKARAKVNLYLAVGLRRDDGYHDIDTVMLSVSLSDELVVQATEGQGAQLVSDFPFDVPPEKNLVVRAYERYCEIFLNERPGVRIELCKRIPTMAGLGGGSADGAAVLLAMARLFGPAVAPEDLAGPAASLGADLPFFLQGGAARATGVGDVLSPLAFPGAIPLLILKPPVDVSTAWAYGRLDEARGQAALSAGGCEATTRAMAASDGSALAASLHNDFQAPVEAAFDEIREGRSVLASLGAIGTLMSGSGSAVFGLFRDQATCHAALERARTRLPSWGCWPAVSTREGVTFSRP